MFPSSNSILVSNLVLEVQSHLLFKFGHNWGHFGTFFHPSGLFLGLESGSKTFSGPFYTDNQLWFWKQSPIFPVFDSSIFGAFKS